MTSPDERVSSDGRMNVQELDEELWCKVSSCMSVFGGMEDKDLISGRATKHRDLVRLYSLDAWSPRKLQGSGKGWPQTPPLSEASEQRIV